MPVTVRARFRELIASPKILVIPGAYDALSARMIEVQGFEAVVGGGYAATGSLLGEPDIGQSNMRDYADHYARICAAVELPVTVDADTGFGGVHNVAQTVRAFENAGVASMSICDQVFPNRCGYFAGKEIVPVEEMLARISAALDARRDADMVIIARTDAAKVRGIDEAIERCQLFIEAGADVAKPANVDNAEEIARVVREVPGPYFATLSRAADMKLLDIADLEALGAAAVSLPSLAIFAAAQAVMRVLARVASSGSMAGIDDELLPLEQYYEIVGLARQRSKEESFAAMADKIATATRSTD